jgi:hypothetical protein
MAVVSIVPLFAGCPSPQRSGIEFDGRGIGSSRQTALCRQMVGQIASRSHPSVGQFGTGGLSAIPHRLCSLQATGSRAIRALQGRRKGIVSQRQLPGWSCHSRSEPEAKIGCRRRAGACGTTGSIQQSEIKISKRAHGSISMDSTLKLLGPR